MIYINVALPRRSPTALHVLVLLATARAAAVTSPSPYAFARSQILAPDGSTTTQEITDREGNKYFDAELPSIIEQKELRGREALDTVHGVAEHVVMPGMSILIVVILAGSWLGLQKYTALVPESAWTVLISAMLGCFVRGLLSSGMISDHKYVWASATFLNLFLLPIIIFESGWALNHFNFLSQLEYIVTFAVVGTLISFFFVGLIGYWLAGRGFLIVDSLREHLAFAALISAVDPVATLSTFSTLGLDSSQPLLHTMIFGESVINDAVAIVLFHTINSRWEDLTMMSCIQDILVLLFGSASLGIVLSGILIWLLRVARLPGNTIPETLYIIVSAWFIFAAAEGVKLSGIIANLCAGSMFRLYGAQHLEEKGLEMTSEYLEVTAHLMDNMVFMLCGVSTALIDSFRGLQFGMIAFILCLLGRAISTFSCAQISNGIKLVLNEPKSQWITIRHQCMMWHAGLRGGIALLLALELDGSWCHHKATIINGTFIIICATLLLLGTSTEPFLRVLGFKEMSRRTSLPLGRESTLMEEIQADGAKLKPSMINFVHKVLNGILVGDLGKGQAQREKKREFRRSIMITA